MGNMSYCRFENTLNDLQDCRESLYDPASEEENKCREKLILCCAQILGDMGVYLDMEDIENSAKDMPID